MHRVFLVVLALMCLATSSCWAQGPMNPMTDSQEVRDAVRAKAKGQPSALEDPVKADEAKFGILNRDTEENRQLWSWLESTVRFMGQKGIQMKSVEILNTDMLNAYAVPDGRVVVYRGLLVAIRDQKYRQDATGMLIFVLGHEWGHITKKHSAKVTMAHLKGLLLGVLCDHFLLKGKGRNGPEWLGETVIGNNASRDAEYQADQEGVRTLELCGLPAEDGVKALEMLFLLSGDQKAWFLMDHPLLSLRMKRILDEEKNKKLTGEAK